MKRRPEIWILGAAVLAFFYRPLTTGTFFFRDLYQLFYPKKLLLIAAIKSGELPLWDPTIHGGQPFLASPSNAFFQPSNILYFILPAIAAFNLAIVLHFLLCAIGAWWLARSIGLSPAASFTCGAIFTLCGYTLSAANLLLIYSLPAFPFALAFIHRAMRGSRAALIGAACAIAYPLLSGGAEADAMLIVTVVAWSIATEPRRAVRPVILAILFGIGLGLLQIIPATEVIRNSSRAEARSFRSFTAWSVNPRRLPELFVPRFFGDTGKLDDRAYWGAELETERFPYMLSIYFGALAFILAALGAFAARDEIPRRTLLLLAIAGIVLSLGRSLPLLERAYNLMPVVGTFRFPVKAIEISLLPVAVLAACGVDAIRRRHAVIVGVVAVVFLIVGTAFTTSSAFGSAIARTFFLQPLSEIMHRGLAVSMWHVVIVLIVATLAVAMERKELLAAVVLLDLAIAGLNVNIYAPRTIFDEPAIAPRVRALVGDGRLYRAPNPPDLQLRAPSDDILWLARWNIETLAGYTASMYGMPVIFSADYDDLAPRAVSHLTKSIDALSWPQRIAVLRAAGVRAFIGNEPVPVPGVIEVARLRTAEAHPLFVHAMPDVHPGQFHGPCAGSVALVRRSFNASVWEASAPCDGVVTIAETWYPAWHVFVDDREQPLLRANGAFSAVKVARGEHTIVKRYAPRRPLAGAIAAAIALVALIAVSLSGSAARP